MRRFNRGSRKHCAMVFVLGVAGAIFLVTLWGIAGVIIVYLHLVLFRDRTPDQGKRAETVQKGLRGTAKLYRWNMHASRYRPHYRMLLLFRYDGKPCYREYGYFEKPSISAGSILPIAYCPETEQVAILNETYETTRNREIREPALSRLDLAIFALSAILVTGIYSIAQ